jgi:hypothetical protein
MIEETKWRNIQQRLQTPSLTVDANHVENGVESLETTWRGKRREVLDLTTADVEYSMVTRYWLGHCVQKVHFHSLTPRSRTAGSLGAGHRTSNEASQVSEYSPSRDRTFPYMAPEIAVSNLDGGERGRYDKNPRRKTREDRYEPRVGTTQKSGNHGSRQDSKSKARPRKARKRSEISGSFQPTNVMSGRLTVGNT